MSNINVQPVSNNVSYVFPVGLYAASNILSEEENDIVCNKIYKLRDVFKQGNVTDWMSSTASPDNCFQLTNLAEYLEFKPLIERVTQCVHEFAQQYGSQELYECTESWYNVYTSGRYQEFHMHPGNIFSVIYYAKVPKGASPTYFKRPDMGSMLPPKNKVRDTPLNQDMLIAPPQKGTAIIFRSNLQHSVPPTTFDGDRITVAFNFA